MRNVADTGLNILYQLLQNVSNHPEAAQSFYQTYYTDILQHMFSVVTDTSHTAGLNMHATGHTKLTITILDVMQPLNFPVFNSVLR